MACLTTTWDALLLRLMMCPYYGYVFVITNVGYALLLGKFLLTTYSVLLPSRETNSHLLMC